MLFLASDLVGKIIAQVRVSLTEQQSQSIILPGWHLLALRAFTFSSSVQSIVSSEIQSSLIQTTTVETTETTSNGNVANVTGSASKNQDFGQTLILKMVCLRLSLKVMW